MGKNMRTRLLVHEQAHALVCAHASFCIFTLSDLLLLFIITNKTASERRASDTSGGARAARNVPRSCAGKKERKKKEYTKVNFLSLSRQIQQPSSTQSS